MKTKNLSIIFLFACLGLLLLSACTQLSPGGKAAAGPVSWIDKPHKGASLPLGAVEVVSHSNDPGGVTQVEMSANGKVFASLPVSDKLARAAFTWTPVAAGNYVVRVRAQNGSGVWGDYTEANIQVGASSLAPLSLPACDNPTPVCPTLPPTPVGFVPPPPPVCGGDTPTPTLAVAAPVTGLIPSFTPTLAGAAPVQTAVPSLTPTLAGAASEPLLCIPAGPILAGSVTEPPQVCDVPTPTPVCITPTPTLAGITPTATLAGITPTATLAASANMTFTHQVSASLFHYGGCAPGQVTISVAVSDPAAVRSVILFTRLEDQQSRQQTPWDEGTSMVRAGTGRYQITLNPNSIANYKTYDPAWLLYQFVATNSKEEVIARSPRIYDVTISACGSAPAPVPVPRDIITVTPVKPFPILPVIPRE